MTLSLADAGLLLVQAAGTLPDTIVTKQMVEDPTLWNQIASVASGVVSITLVVLTVALVPAAWNFRKSYKRINELLDKVYGDVHPIMRHAHTISDNVNYITTSIRVDVQQVNQTIATANERLMDAVRVTEQRLQDFNALLQVVQQEAEDVFVSTASTLHGVRSGAVSFQRAATAPPPETTLVVIESVSEDELDDDADILDEFDDAFDEGESSDGDDREDGTDSRDEEKPRIRPRR